MRHNVCTCSPMAYDKVMSKPNRDNETDHCGIVRPSCADAVHQHAASAPAAAAAAAGTARNAEKPYNEPAAADESASGIHPADAQPTQPAAD